MEDSTITNNQNKIKPFYAIKIFEKGKELDPDRKNTIHLSLENHQTLCLMNCLKK